MGTMGLGMKNSYFNLQCAPVIGGAAVAAIIATGSASFAAEKAKFDTIPLKIVNQSGHPGNLYVLVYGENGDTWYYVKGNKGKVKAFPDSADYAAYGKNYGRKKRFKLRIPEVINARIYFSFDEPMELNTSSAGVPGTPSGWSPNTSANPNPNYTKLFDWFEYGWAVQPAPVPPKLPVGATYLNGNQTQVDMLGIPMLYTFKGVDANNNKTTEKGGFAKRGGRDKIFAAMVKAGSPWRGLVVNARFGIHLRAISPYNGIANNLFPSDQLDSYISSVWSKYTGSTKMSATTTGPTQSFSGSVNGNSLVFTRSSPAGSVMFAKPTTLEAYQGWTPTYSANPDGNLLVGGGELETMMQAGLMRTTMLANGDISDCPGASAYYKNAPVNMYSKIIHQFAYKHLAYGFGYDDVCSQSSDGEVFQPKKVVIKIPKFGK